MPFREIQALPKDLKPSIRGVDYAPLDVLLKKYADSEKRLNFLKKYEQYFKAITTDTSYNESLMNVTKENSDYLQKHRLWFPYLKIEALNLPKMEELLEESDNNGSEAPVSKDTGDDKINNITTTTNEKLKELTEALETNFFNYLHIPYMFGEEPIPPLINHVSNDLNNDIYIFGGLTLMDQKEQNELLHYITDDGLIPLENVQVNFNYNLPVPLNGDILKSPFMKPNNELYIYSSASQTLSKPDLYAKGSGKRNRKEEQDPNEVPPGLLACHSCVISKRHIFYYGGFEIKTTITKRDTSATIDKEIVMNNRAWVLDTGTLKFKHVTLTVHPTLTTRFPSAIARFGHLCLSVPLEEMNQLAASGSNIRSSKETSGSSVSVNVHEKRFTNPALVYITAGYKQSKNSKDFIPLNDIWKIEIFVNYENQKSNYINFNNSALAYPIGDFVLDERNYDDFPSGRHSVKSDLSSDEESESPINAKLNTRSRRSSSLSQPDAQGDQFFSGIIKNSNSEWPDPRGFFAGSLFDNSQLYKDVKRGDSESETHSPPSANIAHPVPKSSSMVGFPGSARSPGGSSSPLGNTVTNASGTTTFSSPPPRAYSPLSPSEGPLRARRRSFSQRQPQSDTYRRISPSHSSATTPSQVPSTFNGTVVNKTLIMHGGSTYQYRMITNSKSGKVQKFTKKKILSDLWWFNLADEKWRKIPTYLSNTVSSAADGAIAVQEAQVKRCGHTALKLDDRYLVLMGGALEIDFKNEAYFNDYKKDTSSEQKSTSEMNASSGSNERPQASSDESGVEDIQELALRVGAAQSSSGTGDDQTQDFIQMKTAPRYAHDNYHRMLVLDTETQYWRISRYFHDFNVRARNYTESPIPSARLAAKIADSLRRAFFSNICGTAVTFDAKIFVIGGECRPHLPEEISNLQLKSVAEGTTQIMFSSICVFEIPLGK